MLKKYTILAFNYAFFEGLQKIISFGMVPVFLNRLGASEYGSFVIFSYWVGLISVLISCGLTNGVSQYIYDKSESDINSLIWSPVIQITILFILSSVLILCAHIWGGYLEGLFKADTIAVILLMASVYFAALNSYFRSCFIYLENTKIVNASTLISLVVANVLAAFFIIVNDQSVIFYALSVLISMIFSVLFLAGNMLKYSDFNYDLNILIAINKFSFPLFVASFVMLFFDTVDKYVIQAHYSKEDNSIYNIAFQFASITGIAIAGFLSVWPGMFHKNKKKLIDSIFFAKITFWYTAISSMIVCVVVFVSTYSINILYPIDFKKGIEIVIPLSAAIVLQGLYSIILMKLLTSGLTHVKLILEIFITCAAYIIFMYLGDAKALFEISCLKYLFYIVLLTSAIISLNVNKLIDSKLVYIYFFSIFIISSTAFCLYLIVK